MLTAMRINYRKEVGPGIYGEVLDMNIQHIITVKLAQLKSAFTLNNEPPESE